MIVLQKPEKKVEKITWKQFCLMENKIREVNVIS